MSSDHGAESVGREPEGSGFDGDAGSEIPTSGGLRLTLIASTVIAALGGLLFGFDTAVISGTTGGCARYSSSVVSAWGSPSRVH